MILAWCFSHERQLILVYPYKEIEKSLFSLHSNKHFSRVMFQGQLSISAYCSSVEPYVLRVAVWGLIFFIIFKYTNNLVSYYTFPLLGFVCLLVSWKLTKQYPTVSKIVKRGMFEYFVDFITPWILLVELTDFNLALFLTK